MGYRRMTDWKSRKFLLRQYNVGSWLGAGKLLLGRVGSYIGLVNFLSINIVLWTTVVKKFAPEWLSYPVFLGFFILLLLIGIIFEYKFVLPSDYSFGLWQWWFHPDNYLRHEMEELRKEIRELKK